MTLTFNSERTGKRTRVIYNRCSHAPDKLDEFFERAEENLGNFDLRAANAGLVSRVGRRDVSRERVKGAMQRFEHRFIREGRTREMRRICLN